MGRRYDEDARPHREWKGLRFLGGVILGVLVCGALLTAWSSSVPNPLYPDDQRQAAAETAQETPRGPEAAPGPVEQAPSPSAGADAPSAAPTVAAPDQPQTQDGLADAPARTELRDSAVEGDFRSTDSAVALRQPGAAPMPAPSISVGGTPQNPGLQLEGPALEVNAVPFESDGTTPLVAVILTGAGRTDLTDETLLSLAVPLTLALAAEDREDTRLAAAAKLAGYEVVAELPVRAEAGTDALSLGMSDVDLADRVAALLSRLWMSVGAMPRFADGVEGGDRFSRAFIAVLERNGFAYVTPVGGEVAGAQSVADAFGVPFVAGDVSVADDVGSDAAYNALDRAAEAARSGGTAVLRGPASRAMLEGILRWSLERSEGEARIAPLSAVVLATSRSAATQN